MAEVLDCLIVAPSMARSRRRRPLLKKRKKPRTP
jgi:hypothetical protein